MPGTLTLVRTGEPEAVAFAVLRADGTYDLLKVVGIVAANHLPAGVTVMATTAPIPKG